MRKPLVVGNWKMNGSREQAGELASAVAKLNFRTAEIAICPSFVFLGKVADHLRSSQVALGAQNLCDHPSGAYTGEVSAAMLADVGCRYVIIGHSERRSLYGETDALVVAKTQAALREGLQPIICVGETLEQRRSGQAFEVVSRQLDAVLVDVDPAALSSCCIAYEPVWAIGTGEVATPQQAEDMLAFIRQRLGGIGAQVRLLYGGSVNPGNAGELFKQSNIDGALVGGASLDAAQFAVIGAEADR